ncbi:MAG: apolipoprotein N-acyltransferase [Bacteroidales bacterium]|nr:apolipoprotein N-acyltransferase [Bacteroidales bacterium]
MKLYHKFFFAIASGLLLSIGWPSGGFSFILLFALVPLLFIEDYYYRNRKRPIGVFIFAYSNFFIWNILTTYWIYYSTFFGAVMAIVFNSLFMAIFFYFFHITRRHIYKGLFFKKNYGYIVLISYWVTFEFLHMNWDLTWSWMNLGNGFANYYKFIQWYEYTGVLGGSVWILLTNILIYQFIKLFLEGTITKRKLIINLTGIILIIFAPIIFSIITYYNYKETPNPVQVVAVQPNIDPYNEKFDGMSGIEQVELMISLASQKTNDSTDFVITPETSISGLWMDEFDSNPAIRRFRKLIERYPQLSVVTGASMYELYEMNDERSVTSRKLNNYNGYYDIYNSAVFIDSTEKISYYHKSKLVPGVEKMPYPQIFGFLEKFAINLGGMVGTHGTQKERSVFENHNGIKVGPVICYESIYGDFVTGYVRNGAQLIFILTNDGWWEDTPGYKQHLEYARLRAIENRRSVARSANTGISAFINQRGDMLQKTEWWTPDVIKQSINANEKITFYSYAGDYIGRILSFLSLLMAFYTITNLIINRSKKL